MGKDGGNAIAYGIVSGKSLVQFLHLRSVTLSNDEGEILAEALEDYYFLTDLDLSQNRLEGARGGNAIGKILNRKKGRDRPCYT